MLLYLSPSVIKKLPTTSIKKQATSRSERGDFSINKPASLYLQDGTVFSGQSPDWQNKEYSGEVVFNTGMTGYVESLTDPSYAGQILVFTYPLIGNYGIQPSSGESDKIQVRGVVVSQAAWEGSHRLSEHTLYEWLASQKIPILTGVDTRALTKHLRTKGTMPGAISKKPVSTKDLRLNTTFVSVPEPVSYGAGHTKKIILVDCGAKSNILRSLLEHKLQVKRVPYNYDYTNEEYDGVLISNGPGDPSEYTETIAITQKSLALTKPIFGICLGSQIMGLAAGARTYKLPFGHRGHNQPCVDLNQKHCYITSQNHGYAIDEGTLPAGWRASFRNLNDGSVEGIEHKAKPFFSVQFHPEACPGPTDTAWLFERFFKTI